MMYNLGDTHILVDIKRTDEGEDNFWLCTAYIGNSIAMQLETPYSPVDIKSNIEYEFCRMIALELSKSISVLLLCKGDENE